MKKGRFLWSAHRITEKQKAGKARNIKEKQLKNSRSTVSKQLVEHHSSPNVKQALIGITQEITEELLKLQANPGNITFPGFFFSPWKRGGTGENRVKITGLAARL